MRGEIRALATAWFGVMQKCCKYVEDLVTACADLLSSVAADSGAHVIQKIASGKPIDRLTLGQKSQILEALDAVVSPQLRRRFPNVVGSRLLGKAGVKMLHELTRIRNDFAHGRWTKEDGDHLAVEFLTAAMELCNSPLVSVTIAIEEDRT